MDFIHEQRGTAARLPVLHLGDFERVQNDLAIALLRVSGRIPTEARLRSKNFQLREEVSRLTWEAGSSQSLPDELHLSRQGSADNDVVNERLHKVLTTARD